MYVCVCSFVRVFVCRKQRTTNKYRNMCPSLPLSLLFCACVYVCVGTGFCNVQSPKKRKNLPIASAVNIYVFLELKQSRQTYTHTNTHMQNAINQRTICIDRTSHDVAAAVAVAVTASSLKAHFVQIWFPHSTNSFHKWWQRASLWTRLCTKVTSCAT